MNQENRSPSSKQKLKFTPKAPKRRAPTRRSQPTSGADEDADSELLFKRFQEKLQGRKHTTENKSASVRFAVGFGSKATMPNTTSPTSLVKTCTSTIPSSSIFKSGDIVDQTLEDALDESNSEDEFFQEPWDYEGSYYPTTLPVRRPYSGNPDILDEAEFGVSAGNAKNVKAAAELGFLDKSVKESLMFFQLPSHLPSLKGSVSSNTKGKEPIGEPAKASHKCSSWEDLPAGHLGKLLVYNSGAVKLKLGEILYDVNPGGKACEHVMALNIKTKDSCLLGQIEKHAVVSVDVDSIMDGLMPE